MPYNSIAILRFTIVDPWGIEPQSEYFYQYSHSQLGQLPNLVVILTIPLTHILQMWYCPAFTSAE